MKELFVEKKFNAQGMSILAQIERILATYSEQGYDLTLRQLFYQFVAHDLFPDDRKWREINGKWVKSENGTKNAEPNYKWLGSILSDGRLAGLIDWNMITDRGREMVSNPHWDSPADIVEAAAKGFRINKWEEQPNHVEVMVEKQALEGVLIPVCRELDINFTSNKGYSSSSAMYEAGKRLAKMARAGKELYVIYLGDHDPSGMDMSRDIDDRLRMFAEDDVVVNRVALNMPQIKKLQPPENPTKLKDSRANNYIRQFGESSWELDAIEPKALAKIVKDAVVTLRDPDQWEVDCAREQQMRDDLQEFADTYEPKE